MEVQCRQLIDDDRDRKVSLAIDTSNQTVQNQGVQRADNLFLLRVIGDDKVRRMLTVGNLQVEVIPCKYPIGFRGHQTGSVHTESSNHTFQLVHGLVLPC